MKTALFLGSLLFSTILKAQNCLPLTIERIAADGKIINQVNFEYNKQKKLISKTTVSYQFNIATETVEKNQYDNKNNLVETERKHNGKLVSTLKMNYNAAGKLISKKQMVGNITTSLESENENVAYWDNGQIATKRNNSKTNDKEINQVLDANNNLLTQETKEFDKRGNLKNINRFDSKSNVNQTIKYQYDNQNLKLRETHYYNEKETMSIDYTYSNKKLIATKALRPDNKEPYRIEYKYQNDLLVEVDNYAFGKLITRTTKSYDDKKNIIKEVVQDPNLQILNYTNYTYECN